MNDRCANCDRELEPWTGEPGDRPPCPDCGGTARIIELSTREDLGISIQAEAATIEVTGQAIVSPPTMESRGTVHPPTVHRAPSVLEKAIADLQADHARLFLVTDLGGGTFHAEVRDERGQVLGEGIGDDMEDALLELAEHLLDRGGDQAEE